MNYKVRAKKINTHHGLCSIPNELKVLWDAHALKKEIKLVSMVFTVNPHYLGEVHHLLCCWYHDTSFLAY